MLLPILTAIFFITLFAYFFNGFKKRGNSKSRALVPGLAKSDKVLGNLPDVFKAGSLPKFLFDLHSKHGPVASFWMKDVFTVSLADPKYYKITEKMFDRHPSMFEFAIPLISEKSQQFQNGNFGRYRYKLLSQPFGFDGCAQVLEDINKIVREDISSWKNGGKVGLHEQMMKLAIDIITKTHFGCHFKDKENCDQLNEGYSKVIKDFDDALLGLWSFGQGDAREQDFERNLGKFKLQIRNIVKDHVQQKSSGDYDVAPFLDAALDIIDDEDDLVHQAITFLIGGFHTSGTYMTWFFYNLSLNPAIQDRVRDEIKAEIKSDGLKDMKDIDKLTYTKMVMDETLRHMKVGTFSERMAENDIEIEGYQIPKGSQIINSLCLTLDNSEAFPNPNVFDPTNFENSKAKGLAFSPFGFGVRKCPGYRFANLEMVVAAVEILSRFKVEAVDTERIVQPVYGFITKPESECWVTLKED